MSIAQAGSIPAVEGFVDRLDARTRLLAAVAVVLTCVAMSSLAGKALTLALTIALAFAARLEAAGTLRRLAHMEGFLIVLFLLLPFSVAGDAVFSFGPLVMTQQGLLRAAGIAITVNASVLGVLALLSTLEPVRLGRAMAAFGVPAKLVHLFLFLVRYLELLRVQAGQLREAIRARAFAPRLSMHSWRTFGNFAGMLLVRSIERAERVDEAMRCRGFSGRFPLRTIRRLTMLDACFAAMLGLVLAALVAWEWLA